MNDEEKVRWVAERLMALQKLADDGIYDLALQLRREGRLTELLTEEVDMAYRKCGVLIA